NHGSEHAVPHAGDDLVESDRGRNFHVKFLQVVRVGAIGVLADREVGPRRIGVPAVSRDAYTPDPRPHPLHGFEDAFHLPPSEPVVTDVEHAVALLPEIEGDRPRRIIGMKEECLYVRLQRMLRWLVNLVREAFADLDPVLALRSSRVVVIADHADGIIELAVTVDYDSPRTRHIRDQPHPIDLIAELQVRGPFENEDDGVALTDFE